MGQFDSVKGCWERLRAGGEGGDRGWDAWTVSLTQWMWVWVNFGRWWRTRKPGVLQSMGSQRVRHDWVTETRDVQRAGKMLFLDASPWRCFWIRWTFELMDWVKQLALPDVAGHHLIHLGHEDSTSQRKREFKNSCSLSAWQLEVGRGSSLALRPAPLPLASLDLRSWDLDRKQPHCL